MAIPLLDALDICGKHITADALLTQRELAQYIVQRGAHYHFAVKANQPQLLEDLTFYFQHRQAPEFVEVSPPEHGRIETRKIWTTTALTGYLNFPHLAQASLIEREVVHKKSGKQTHELAYMITSSPVQPGNAQRLLRINRGHWSIENSCHYPLDWTWDEDRSRIRTGHGPENITRLRRFAITVIKSKPVRNLAQKIRQLNRDTRLVFDYLCMSQNAQRAATP